MADEDSVVDFAGGFALFYFVEAVLCALDCVAVRENLYSECDMFAVGRENEVCDIEGQIGDLSSFATIDGDLPELGGVCPFGEEED